jgi:uncharacterized protein (TIGR03663 family)
MGLMLARRARHLLISFAVVLFIAAALWSRGWRLDERPVAHDESLFGCFAYWLAVNGNYEYDPLMHGPLLLEAQSLIFMVCGSDQLTMRLFPALCGLALIAAMLLFRPWLGKTGVTAAMLLILCSPTILFYSRFLRNDIPFLLATTLAVGCLGRALGRRERNYLPFALIALGLMACIKENTVFVLFTFICFSAALLAVDLWSAKKAGSSQFSSPPPPLPQGPPRRWSPGRVTLTVCWMAVFWGAILLFDQVFIATIAPDFQLADFELRGKPIGAGAAFTALIFCLLCSAIVFYLFVNLWEKSKRPGNLWTETKKFLWDNRYLVGAGCCAAWLLLTLVFSIGLNHPASIIVLARDTVAYWWREHATQRLGGPFHYYWPLLVVYELPALCIVIAGALLAIARGRLMRLLALPFFLLLTLSLVTTRYSIDQTLPEQSSFASLCTRILERIHVNTLGNLLWATAVIYWGVCLTFSALVAGKRFRAFAITWLSVSLLCYSYAGEKAPWLVVHLTLPLLVLAAEELARLWRWLGVRRRPKLGRAIFLTGCVPLLAWNAFVASRTCHAEKDWPTEIIVHNHTTPEFEAVAKQIRTAQWRADAAPSTPTFHASITGEAVWPMIWYLRKMPEVQWDEPQTPEDEWFIIDNEDDRTTGGLLVRTDPLFSHEDLPLRTHWELEYVTWDEPESGEINRLDRFIEYTLYYLFREIPGDTSFDEQKSEFSVKLHINRSTVKR